MVLCFRTNSTAVARDVLRDKLAAIFRVSPETVGVEIEKGREIALLEIDKDFADASDISEASHHTGSLRAWLEARKVKATFQVVLVEQIFAAPVPDPIGTKVLGNLEFKSAPPAPTAPNAALDDEVDAQQERPDTRPGASARHGNPGYTPRGTPRRQTGRGRPWGGGTRVSNR